MISLENQRTILGITVAVLLLSNLYLSISISRVKRTVVLVPTIDKEMTVAADWVSEDYLLVRAEQIMQLLFNIRHENFSYNIDQILKQVSSKSKPQFAQQLNEFAKDVKSKKYFYTFHKDAFAINASKLEITFSGYLDVFVNDKKIKTNHKSYKLAFTNNYGLVRLVSFEEVTDAKD